MKCGAAGDVLADLVGAGEGDDLGHRVGEQCVADSAMSDHHVQQAGGQSRLLEHLRHQGAAADRGVLVRLEDHGVAERQCRGDRPWREEGEVERADDAHDADRDAVDAVLLAVDRSGEAALGRSAR